MNLLSCLLPDANHVRLETWSLKPALSVIPDILCNAGGVIVSYFEWVQDLQRLFWSEAEVNDRLERLLEGAFSQITRRAAAERVPMRTAAMAIGVEKVRTGKRLRGLFP